MQPKDIARLCALTSFPALVAYLRDELDWPIEVEDADDITFDYDAAELGIDPKHAVKIEAIKQKHANDKARLQQEMMKVYREQGINPFGQVMSCLPMALQMPIWVALYSSLSNNIALLGDLRELTAGSVPFPRSPEFDQALIEALEVLEKVLNLFPPDELEETRRKLTGPNSFRD